MQKINLHSLTLLSKLLVFSTHNHNYFFMFSREEQTGANGRQAETIIGPSIKVEGNFVGQGNIIVDGTVVGTLKTSEDVRVGPQAQIEADVEGHNIHVAGNIKGNLKVNGKLELTSSATIHGDVEAEVLSMEAGATFDGHLTVGKNGSAASKETKEK